MQPAADIIKDIWTAIKDTDTENVHIDDETFLYGGSLIRLQAVSSPEAMRQTIDDIVQIEVKRFHVQVMERVCDVMRKASE